MGTYFSCNADLYIKEDQMAQAKEIIAEINSYEAEDYNTEINESENYIHLQFSGSMYSMADSAEGTVLKLSPLLKSATEVEFENDEGKYSIFIGPDADEYEITCNLNAASTLIKRYNKNLTLNNINNIKAKLKQIENDLKVGSL